MAIDLGFVGRPVEVNPGILTSFLGSDFIPVLAPIGAGRHGETFNVNGDTAAGAIAAAMKADRLLLLTDVAGVKDAGGAVVTALTAADVRELTADGVISGGMIPKTQTALDAIEGGVRAVVILDGRAPHAVLLGAFHLAWRRYADPGVSTLAAVAAPVRAEGLAVLGAFHPGPDDGAPAGCGTLVLLGPDGPGFWRIFQASAEFGDGRADPLDRWSERVIGGLAAALGGQALLPFGGPPWLPFTGVGAAEPGGVGLAGGAAGARAARAFRVVSRGAGVAGAAGVAGTGGAAMRGVREAVPRRLPGRGAGRGGV